LCSFNLVIKYSDVTEKRKSYIEGLINDFNKIKSGWILHYHFEAMSAYGIPLHFPDPRKPFSMDRLLFSLTDVMGKPSNWKELDKNCIHLLTTLAEMMAEAELISEKVSSYH